MIGRSSSRGRLIIGVAAAAVVLVLAMATQQASARLIQFASPTKNIGCLADDFDGKYTLRCDIGERSFTPPTRPRSCPLDYGGYGDSFTLLRRGPASWTCHGDTALPGNQPGFRTLRYGKTWSWGPFRCTMRMSGITCRNAQRYGFLLSRERAVRLGPRG